MQYTFVNITLYMQQDAENINVFLHVVQRCKHIHIQMCFRCWFSYDINEVWKSVEKWKYKGGTFTNLRQMLRSL